MKKKFILLFISLSTTLATHIASAQTTIFTEDFDYPLGDLPADWVIDADQPPGWSINESQIAGGVAPELYLTYGFQVGLSRLISPVIDVDGHEELAISHKQYLINYAGDWGETIGMDVTFDGGDSWQPLWEMPLGLLNIPQDEFVYFVENPGAMEMQIAFRFEGNNNAINGWAIDDILVEEVVDNDLLVSSISGNTTPIAGEETTYTVAVTNGGKLSQSNYTVKLMTEEGTELASAAGTAIDFAEQIDFELSWTPTGDHIGNHVIYATVEFNDDENPDNNQSKNLIVDVQAMNVESVDIGDATYPLVHSIPFNFFALNNLAQTLYLADDITADLEVENTPITGIQYVCQFDEDVADVPVQIYLAETDLTDLSAGWVDPDSFVLVYDGLMDFHKGFNAHYIPFDEEYQYQGGNLVVYTNKSYPEQLLVWSTFISTYHENPVYSRNVDGDADAFDPMDPPTGFPVFYTPDITLFFESGEMSVLDYNMDSVSVYPNPATDVLNIQTENGAKILDITTINAYGQEVNRKTVDESQYTMGVTYMTPGFYLVHVRTSNGVFTKKILVSK